MFDKQMHQIIIQLIVNQLTSRGKLALSETRFLNPINGKKELFCILQNTVSARSAWLDKTFVPLRHLKKLAKRAVSSC